MATDASKRGRSNRARGAAFELAVAKELHLQLGIKFRRNLEQYQTRGQGDLIPSDDAFPFLLECKTAQNGADCRAQWMSQAIDAAEGVGLYPCVVYRIGSQPWRFRVWFDALAEAFGGEASAIMRADLSITDFAAVVRELMARRAAA